MPTRSIEPFAFADLFSGLGGFHVALSSLGGSAVYAAEWDRGLNSLYERNFGIKPDGDLSTVDPDSVPPHQVLAAGFPCQPFSKAGEQLGFEHTQQGRLFFKVADILDARRPSRFILENVPNLQRHRGGDTFRVMLARLRSLGYDVDWHRYSPHNFGVPQVRDRVYIVGSLEGLQTFQWPDPPPSLTNLRSVLDSSPDDARPLSDTTARALDIWDDFLRSAPKALKLPSFPIWAMEFGADYPYEFGTPYALLKELGPDALNSHRGSFGVSLSGLTEESQLELIPSHGRRREYAFPKWKIDFVRQNRDFYAANRTWIDPWLERSRLGELASSFQKFEWNAQGEVRSVWQHVLQVRASGVRVKRATTAPSLVAMTDTQVPIIGWERRYMTPKECAALQSLGAIHLPNSRARAYRALGNAVNAKVVEQIMTPLLESHSLKRVA